MFPGFSYIRNWLNICANATMGMDAVVTKAVHDDAVVYGNPAKVMCYTEKGSIFSE